MNFIRENMTLVIIAAVAVVAAGALGVVGKLIGGDVQELIDERVSLSQDLRGQSTGERVSEEKLEAKESAVEALNVQAGEIAEETLQWNRRNYELLRLSAGEREVPAFPIDEELYKQYSLKFKFMLAYNDALGSLVQPLRVTQPPDQQQIESRALAWESYLQQQEGDGEEQPDESPYPERGDIEFERERFRSSTPRYSGDDDITVSNEAQEYGLRDAVRQQARAGLIYLQPETALDNLLPEQTISRASITNELLWFAQLNLWVQQDILDAIRLTNEEYITESGGDPDEAGVLDSAVKRLVAIDVDESYYFGGAEQEQAGPEDFGRAGGRSAPSGGSAQRQADTLTRRVTDELHDVIHYRFTVIMRPDQSVRLMEKLMSRNCHAVLERRFGPAGASDDSGDSQEALYDYGPDPVCEVTFTGELLLMTPWTRGRRDSEADQWMEEYPPLVPVEVLGRMPGGLRSEDRQRLRDSGLGGSSGRTTGGGARY